jgi:hypothetical protein
MSSIITPQVEAQRDIRRRIECEVRSRYEAQIRTAGTLRRILLWMRIRREVAVELKRTFPPRALYLHHGTP